GISRENARTVRHVRLAHGRVQGAIGITDQQAAGDDPGPKNHQRGENDFPTVHRYISVSWFTSASIVFSNSSDRSLPVEEPLFRGAMTAKIPNSNAITKQATAARQSPRAHNAHSSKTGRP